VARTAAVATLRQLVATGTAGMPSAAFALPHLDVALNGLSYDLERLGRHDEAAAAYAEAVALGDPAER